MLPLLMIIEPAGKTQPTPKPDTGNDLEAVNSVKKTQTFKQSLLSSSPVQRHHACTSVSNSLTSDTRLSH